MLSHTFVAQKPIAHISLFKVSRDDGCEATYSELVVNHNMCPDICELLPAVISAVTVEEEPAIRSKESCNCHIQNQIGWMFNPVCSSDCMSKKLTCREPFVDFLDACSILVDVTNPTHGFAHEFGQLGNILEGGKLRTIASSQLDESTLECFDKIIEDILQKAPLDSQSGSYSSDHATCLPNSFTSEHLSPVDGGNCSLDSWSNYFEKVNEVDHYNSQLYIKVPVSETGANKNEVNPLTSLFLSLLVGFIFLLCAFEALQVRRKLYADGLGQAKIQPTIEEDNNNETDPSKLSVSQARRLSIEHLASMVSAKEAEKLSLDLVSSQLSITGARSLHQEDEAEECEITPLPDIPSAAKLVPSSIRVHSNMSFTELMGPAGYISFFSLFFVCSFCLVRMIQKK